MRSTHTCEKVRVGTVTVAAAGPPADDTLALAAVVRLHDEWQPRLAGLAVLPAQVRPLVRKDLGAIPRECRSEDLALLFIQVVLRSFCLKLASIRL